MSGSFRQLAGVDWCQGQWLAAIDRGDGTTVLELVPRFADLVRREDLALIVIDVPIGLMERGARRVDEEARRYIGKRRSSVFPAPIRPMLGASSHDEAASRRFDVDGKRCSIQLFSILPIIQNVDRHMTPELQARVREGHPEVSFTALNRTPMQHHKATSEGRAERRAVLLSHFPELDRQHGERGQLAPVEDVHDAYVMLWSARRWAAGTALVLPMERQVDPRGLCAEMVA